MKIGLLNLEPKIENTAMMQVSRFYKDKGATVEDYSPLFYSEYDKIYAFSLFTFTNKKRVRNGMVYGGTGFDLLTRLPPEIEACDLDYSIFPNCKTSYIWFSRGCNNQCPFCIVWIKEGKLHSVIPKNLNPKGEYITVQDNNFFMNLSWPAAIDWLLNKRQPVDFASGLDVRLFNHEQGEALCKLKFAKRLHIAWDNPKEKLLSKILELTQYIKPNRIMCYVLIGYWSTRDEDLERVELLRKIDVDPFAMPYNKSDPYQKAFARWVNRKAVFNSVSWKDYKHGMWKGF